MKLDLIHGKLYEDETVDKSSQTSAEYFDQLLEKIPFRACATELTTISFPQKVSLSEIQADDTDNDDIDNLGAVTLGKKRKKPYNASRLLYAQEEPITDNYLKQNDLSQQDETTSEDLMLSPQRFTERLCCRLALDALRIVEAHPREQTRESTVCLCVLLRNKDGLCQKIYLP